MPCPIPGSHPSPPGLRDHMPIVLTVTIVIPWSKIFHFSRHWILAPDFDVVWLALWLAWTRTTWWLSVSHSVASTSVTTSRPRPRAWFTAMCWSSAAASPLLPRPPGTAATPLAAGIPPPRHGATCSSGPGISSCAVLAATKQIRLSRHGDENTRYFHACASAQMQKNMIASLECDDAMHHGNIPHDLPLLTSLLFL